jgi:hypothetical protein
MTKEEIGFVKYYIGEGIGEKKINFKKIDLEINPISGNAYSLPTGDITAHDVNQKTPKD